MTDGGRRGRSPNIAALPAIARLGTCELGEPTSIGTLQRNINVTVLKSQFTRLEIYMAERDNGRWRSTTTCSAGRRNVSEGVSPKSER